MKSYFTTANLIIVSLIAIVVFLGALMGSSILQKKHETKLLQQPTQKIDQHETRNSVWGKAYKYQWESYMEATRKGDHSTVITDELASNPNLVILWAGYGFASDYNKPRGHTYAVVDIVNTLRTGAPKDEETGPMPATCMSCKSPDVPRLMDQEGVDKFYEGKWARHVKEVTNPIGCADCHNAETMELQISRPALVEAYERQGKKIQDASHQEMRSLVCAQCHVEYYFKKPGNYLTFPWDKGTDVESMEAYYDQLDFKDWTHQLSKAPMLKAQHPGFETFSQGIHGKRGLACADCHMPLKSIGGVKFSDHHLQSPLQNINNACQQCHRVSEADLIANVASLKEKVMSLKTIAEDELVKAHFEAKSAWDSGATTDQMQEGLRDIRHAQWRWDYATAAHGAYFHAPEEVLRVLGTSIQKAAAARRSIAKVLQSLGQPVDVPIPDISTKGLAQTVVGIDLVTMQAEKAQFKETLVKKWWEESSSWDAELQERLE
jgi:nitrite reductase (cytochrome c-552)